MGLLTFALVVMGEALATYDAVASGLRPIGLVALGLGAVPFYIGSTFASFRRVVVFRNGIVSSTLPFTERFTWKSPVLHSEDISEIRNTFAGTRVVGMAFESKKGRWYSVHRAEVGSEMFNNVLAFKRRYYSD